MQRMINWDGCMNKYIDLHALHWIRNKELITSS
jgi:hypothetical protein